MSLLQRSISHDLQGTANVTFDHDGLMARFSIPLSRGSTVGGKLVASAWEGTDR